MEGAHTSDGAHGPSSSCRVAGGATKPQRSPRSEATSPKSPVSPDLVSSTSSGDPVVTLFPRRKQGQKHPGGGRGPVVLNLETLEQFYCYPLHLAAKKLGICQTAIKKVCRRLGIKKWPYKDMRLPCNPEEEAAAASGSASPTDVSEQAENAILVATKKLSSAQKQHSPSVLHHDDGIQDAVTALLTLNSFTIPAQGVDVPQSMNTSPPAVKVEAAN
uniref:RWP-RK domain-containing protein n=1 Tax=Hemiselmis andersenii TaxID=464988 RepID=A0A6U4N0Q2_HEMAN|mmetsp:Transcript_21122/g.48865  ORF Transcript_21122/g.48865 Transcript_21122/m.48865 type:complete len:217 (+) Transcript_21122:519-1169(+)